MNGLLNQRGKQVSKITATIEREVNARDIADNVIDVLYKVTSVDSAHVLEEADNIYKLTQALSVLSYGQRL